MHPPLVSVTLDGGLEEEVVTNAAPGDLLQALETAGLDLSYLTPPESASVTLLLPKEGWEGHNLGALVAFQRAMPSTRARLMSGTPEHPHWTGIAVVPRGIGGAQALKAPDGRMLLHATATLIEAVLLDRDGTLIVDRTYLSDPAGVEFLPGAIAGLRRLQHAGIRRVIVSNQSGIGRGLLSHSQVAAVHDRLRALLVDEGLTLDGIYYCPHAPGEGCICRKPGTGLAKEAAVRLGFDLTRTLVVGDTDADLGLADRLGVTGILVLTGSGPATLEAGNARLQFAVSGLDEMARIIGHPSGLGTPLE